jgi:hypothetical protein
MRRSSYDSSASQIKHPRNGAAGDDRCEGLHGGFIGFFQTICCILMKLLQDALTN